MVTTYTRPTDWLAMPTIGTQEFIGLLAIHNDSSNHIALLCTGAYTVNWGDGVVENIATGVKAQHTYTYSAISDGTISTLGYKQVLVRVTPQAGQNLTSIDLQQTTTAMAKFHTTGWLELSINGSNITSLVLGGSAYIAPGMCEKATIGSLGAITTFLDLFRGFYSLKSVSLSSTSTVVNFGRMFYDCRVLESVPLFDTSSGTNFGGMFSSCNSIVSVPLFNTSKGTNFDTMFRYCHSLKTIPLFNTSLVAVFTSMFTDCKSLKTIPLLNTSSGTDFTNMFFGCNVLKTIPLLNTSSGTNFSGMFTSCGTLRSIPLINTVSGTNFSTMFRYCTRLESVPLLNTANGLTFNNMFDSCQRLTFLPLFNFSKATTLSNTFAFCYSLQQIPEFNVPLCTNFTTPFASSSLAKGKMTGGRYSISYTGLCLSTNAIIDIFNGLGTSVGTQTVTVSNNPGFAALTSANRLIATSKGWTIA